MEPHRQSTGLNRTLCGIMARTPDRHSRSKPRRRVWFLKQWRKYRGLSQEELGAHVGFTQGMISQLENGTSDYTRSHLESLATALDCEPSDLLVHDPNQGESPYSLIERMDADDRSRALEILKALKRG